MCGYSVIFFHMDSRLSQHLSVNRLFISHWIVMILCHSIRFLHALVCFYVPYFVLLLYFSDTAGKSLQSCPTLCNPIDGSPPGSPVPGILQARTLEWVAISFSNAGKWKPLPNAGNLHAGKWSRSVMSDSLWPHGLQPTRLLHPWDFPGKSTGVGCHWYQCV